MDNQLYRPTILCSTKKADQEKLTELFKLPGISICDTLESQLLELLEIREAGKSIKSIDPQDYFKITDLKAYGCWVYYPWRHTLVHCLPEKEFVEVRTSRNKYKILDSEEALLAEKRVGVVGLSVGQAIAITIGQERSVGTLRLADFDHLELSNMNRIRAGIHSIGLPKVLIAARAIAEIDPFLKVEVYPEGINEQNIDHFIAKNGKLDIIIDECDSLNIKLLLREKARQHHIPVIMETNDRCMVDIERFDLEADRPIFHGVLGKQFDSNKLAQLSTKEKIPFVLKILGIDQLSLRMKASLLEIQNSINGWPQIASDVNMGGGILANICRKILLGEKVHSGRYYVDLDEIFSIERYLDKSDKPQKTSTNTPVTPEDFIHVIPSGNGFQNGLKKEAIDGELIKKIIELSLHAPSAGNLQSWEFLHHENSVYIGINKSRTSGALDPLLFGAHVAIGAITENIALAAKIHGLETAVSFNHQNVGHKDFVAKIEFQKWSADLTASAQDQLLYTMISRRKTNREPNHEPVDKSKLMQLNEFLHPAHEERFLFLFDQEKIKALANLIGIADRLRLSHKNFHNELMREVCWTEKEALERRNGIYVKDLGLKEEEIPSINITRDWQIMQFIKDMHKGQGLERWSRELFKKENALGLFITTNKSRSSFFNAGIALQKAWLYSTSLHLDWHPATSLLYFFLQLDFPDETNLPVGLAEELIAIRTEFNQIFQLQGDEGLVMLMRFVNSNSSTSTSLRMPLEEVYRKA
jgi:hypothetical protein